MDRMEELERAKSYLELLSRSIDPTTGEEAVDGVLAKAPIREVFLYIVSVLDELIGNGGEVVQAAKPAEFRAENLDKGAVALSEEPISITGFVGRINKQIDSMKMKRLGASKISDWLVERGYLTAEKVPVTKYENRFGVTETARGVGIVEKEKINEDTGEVKSYIVLTKAAQAYLLDALERIVKPSEEAEAAEEKGGKKDVSTEKPREKRVERKGERWFKSEEEQLIDEYVGQGLSMAEIGRRHRRSAGGIRARLKKLGLIEE